MKKQLFFLIFSCLLYTGAAAQSTDQIAAKTASKSGINAIAFGLSFPVGVFSHSHSIGAVIDYSWSRHRFGENIPAAKPIGFIINAGADYFIGKRTTTTGYEFRYGNYLNLYAMPGIICNPIAKGNISLTTGPALSIYKGNANGGISVGMFGNYWLTKNIAIGSGTIYRKHLKEKAMWSVAIRVSYAF